MNELLEERDADGILWLTFNRPEARNAMTFAMYDRLGEIAREVSSEDSFAYEERMDFQEGMSAFLEKRKPQWQGR